MLYIKKFIKKHPLTGFILSTTVGIVFVASVIPVVAATVTLIQSTDTISDFVTVQNANVTNLNTDKLESGDYASTLDIGVANTEYVTASSTTATSTFAGDLSFGTGLYWDGSEERLSIGTSVNELTINGTTKGSLLYTESQGGGNAYDIIFERHSNTASSVLTGVRSRGSHASPSIVQDGDNIFEIKGAGYDGTDWEFLAEIHFEVDGTPGNNDMPGVIRFLTTPDGSVTPTEKMRITQAGLVGIGTSSPLSTLTVHSGQVAIPIGSLGVPGFTFNDDLDTGFYQTAVNTINFGVGGSAVGTFSATGIVSVVGFDANDGAVTTPSYSFTSDTNTGMYLSGTDSLSFSVGGNEAISIDSAVKVGIGTSTPFAKLSVENTGATDSLLVNDEATDQSPFVVDASGNVGIGTTTPYKKLSVVGEVAAESFTATSTTATSTFNGGVELELQGSGIEFFDGTIQTTAASSAGGISTLLTDGNKYSTTAGESLRKTFTIPAGTLDANSAIEIDFNHYRSGSAVGNSTSLDFGDGSSTTTVKQFSSQNSAYSVIHLHIQNQNTLSTQYYQTEFAHEGASDLSTNASNDGTTSYNTANNLYIAFYGGTDSGSETWNNGGMKIVHYPTE